MIALCSIFFWVVTKILLVFGKIKFQLIDFLVGDRIVFVIQFGQPATDVSFLFLYVPLVRIYSHSGRKFYLLVPNAGHKIDICRLFGLGLSLIEIVSDLIAEKLCIHKAVFLVCSFFMFFNLVFLKHTVTDLINL